MSDTKAEWRTFCTGHIFIRNTQYTFRVKLSYYHEKGTDFASPMKQSVTVSAVEITAVLQRKYKTNGEWKVGKCYEGKSSRRVTRNQKSEEVLQKNKEEITKEAKRAALEYFFSDRYGLTEFNDMIVDELGRPMKD